MGAGSRPLVATVSAIPRWVRIPSRVDASTSQTVLSPAVGPTEVSSMATVRSAAGSGVVS